MSETRPFVVLDETTNAVVLRHRDRAFPGILLQGDTLRTLLDEVEELVEAAEKEQSSEISGIAESLDHRLREMLRHYEAVLKRHGITQPYQRSAGEQRARSAPRARR